MILSMQQAQRQGIQEAIDRHEKAVEAGELRRESAQMEKRQTRSQLIDGTADALSKRLGIPKEDMVKLVQMVKAKALAEDKEDMIQTVSLALLKTEPHDIRLAWTIAKREVGMYWRKWRIRQHDGIDSELEDTNTEVQEALVSAVEWETAVEGKIDGQILAGKLPERIQGIVQQRLDGKRLPTADRTFLSRWIAKEGYKLLIA